MVKMLVGLIYPTSGHAEIFGRPLGNEEAKKRMGFLPETFRYQEWLTGYQLLSFHANLYRMTGKTKKNRIQEVLQLVRLTGHENKKIKAYSKGMQQRLGLATALLADPDLLILDEPTSAMDPLGRKEVRDLILKLKNEGKTIFLNSHLLSEVEILCDHVALIKNGSIIAGGTIEELKTGKMEVEMRIGNFNENIYQSFGKMGLDWSKEEGRIIATIQNREQIPLLAETIVNNGGRLYMLHLLDNSLEALFLKIMQEGGDDDVHYCQANIPGSIK